MKTIIRLRTTSLFMAAALAAVAATTAVGTATGSGLARQHATTGQKAKVVTLRAFEAVGDAAVPLPTQAVTDPANVPIATLRLPAGSYTITARAWMHVSDPTDTVPANNVQCTLKAGQYADFIQFDLFAPKIGDDATETSTIVHTFRTAGTVTWNCTQPTAGVTVQALDRKITAVQVSSISETQLH